MVFMLKPSVGQISSMLSPLNLRTTVVLPVGCIMAWIHVVVLRGNNNTGVVQADHQNAHFALLLANLLGREWREEGGHAPPRSRPS